MAAPEVKEETSTVPAEKQNTPPGVLLIQEVEPKRLSNAFCIMNYDDEFETFNFDGVYTMMRHRNPHSKLSVAVEEFYSKTIDHMRNKAIFVEGNILFKEDAPGIKDAINLMVGITSMNKLPSCVDTSVLKRTQMMWGTICPTKDVLFRYKGMLFILYGRYIYGYNMPYVRFVNKEKLGEKYKYTPEHYEDCKSNEDLEKRYFWEYRRKPLISNDEIILPTVSYEEKNDYMDDYNFSFCILEEASNTLLAFSVYR